MQCLAIEHNKKSSNTTQHTHVDKVVLTFTLRCFQKAYIDIGSMKILYPANQLMLKAPKTPQIRLFTRPTILQRLALTLPRLPHCLPLCHGYLRLPPHHRPIPSSPAANRLQRGVFVPLVYCIFKWRQRQPTLSFGTKSILLPTTI